jgi:hypothetical protein
MPHKLTRYKWKGLVCTVSLIVKGGNENAYFKGRWHDQKKKKISIATVPDFIPNTCIHLDPPSFSLPIIFKWVLDKSIDHIFKPGWLRLS